MKVAFTVFYDPLSGELAKVQFSKEFNFEDPLVRADVLKDALGRVNDLYEASVPKIHAKKRRQQH